MTRPFDNLGNWEENSSTQIHQWSMRHQAPNIVSSSWGALMNSSVRSSWSGAPLNTKKSPWLPSPDIVPSLSWVFVICFLFIMGSEIPFQFTCLKSIAAVGISHHLGAACRVLLDSLNR